LTVIATADLVEFSGTNAGKELTFRDVHHPRIILHTIYCFTKSIKHLRDKKKMSTSYSIHKCRTQTRLLREGLSHTQSKDDTCTILWAVRQQEFQQVSSSLPVPRDWPEVPVKRDQRIEMVLNQSGSL
jgi:hypothetical protein